MPPRDTANGTRRARGENIPRAGDEDRPAARGGRTQRGTQRGTPAKRSKADQPPRWIDRIGAFLLERHPWMAGAPLAVIDDLRKRHGLHESPGDAKFRAEVRRRLESELTVPNPPGNVAPTPGVSRAARREQALDELCRDVDGALAREQIRASLTPEERREILRGMILTRATDNQLKHLFIAGEVRYGSRSFQGKGFRSLGQEAIYAAAIRLRRGDAYALEGGEIGIPIGGDPNRPTARWAGDVLAPMIRDLGAVLAMRPTADTVRMVINAQMGKAGPPMDGRDLHVGDLRWGILPAAAPLGIPTLTISGMAMAFHLSESSQVAVSFIGDGGCSLGEWHEAINLCATRKLPAIFCVQNNQTALSTPLADQTAVRAFADKAAAIASGSVPSIVTPGIP